MNKEKLREYALSPQRVLPWHPGRTVSTNRAAEILGCSNDTILRLLQDGSLEGFKRRRKKNSPFLVIYDSIVRVSEEWRSEAGVLPPKAAQKSTAGPARTAGSAGNRT